MRLDLGSGGVKTKAPGHIGIDSTELEGVDIVWDLNQGLPLYKLAMKANLTHGTHDEVREQMNKIERGETPFIDGVRCNQLVEHLDTIIPLMNHCYTIMKPGALLEISTPLAFTSAWAQDPTHKKMFVLRTFDYFCNDLSTADAREEYGITAKFTRVWDLLEHGWNLQVKLQK